MIFKPFQMKYLIVFVVLALVLSFGIHAIEINHYHPDEIFGEGLSASLHINDKQWWFLLLLAAIAITWAIFWKQSNSLTGRIVLLQKYFVLFNRFLFDTLLLFDPMRQALRRGVLHPKICE